MILDLGYYLLGLSGALFYALKIAYINFMMYLCSEVIIKEVDQNE